MIPEAIQLRLADRTPVRPRADRSISAGDVRRAESGGEERLVVVLRVNSERENAEVTLIHPYTEYATGADVVVEPSVSGTSFPVVVQAGMRGVVWLKDLGRLVADVPPEVVAICLAPAMRLPNGIGLSSGPPMTGPLDARMAFKDSEGSSLARLCAECTAAALDGDLFGLEVDEVFESLLVPSPDADLMLLAILNLWQTRGDQLVFTFDHVEFLDSKGLLSVERWTLALGDNGLSFRLGPLQELIERALAQFGDPLEQPISILGPRELVAAATTNKEF